MASMRWCSLKRQRTEFRRSQDRRKRLVRLQCLRFEDIACAPGPTCATEHYMRPLVFCASRRPQLAWTGAAGDLPYPPRSLAGLSAFHSDQKSCGSVDSHRFERDARAMHHCSCRGVARTANLGVVNRVRIPRDNADCDPSICLV